MLDRISQQLASAGSQISTNFTPLSPYPTFHPSASDLRVSMIWLISLVCSLSAALLATLVQQWVRAYMRIFQHSSNPLKTARIRSFLFEGVERLPMVAEAVPGLIHFSVIFFLWGLGDTILQIDTTVFVVIVVPIGICVCLYLYCVVAPISNPQSPYRTPLSNIVWYLTRKLYRSPFYTRFIGKVVQLSSTADMATRQEQLAVKKTRSRLVRDVHAVRWLIDNINGSNETENFVLSIPGSFNQEWGRDVWRGVVNDGHWQWTSTVDSRIQTLPDFPSSRDTTVHDLCRCVRYFFDAYRNEGDSMDMEGRLRRMRGCVQTAASLVCCNQVELRFFGEVGEVLSALGNKERTNDPSTIRSNPLFAVRWTCLSLVAIWKMIDGNRLQELARIALNGIAHSQTDYGAVASTAAQRIALNEIAHSQTDYDAMALTAAQRIDDHLKKAWAPVLDLHLAFEPWSQDRTESEIKRILNSRGASISELERIATEAVGLGGVDWRISLLQEAMDETTEKLMRYLPGVSFSELKPAVPVMLSEAFDFSLFNTALRVVPPQLIFPGQQIQSLCTLGRRLHDIIEDRNTEMHEETLKSLESLPDIPVSLRRFNDPMKQQLWRLLDLRDGGGLGFTIELFFLALKPLSSASSSSELKEVFYTGTFKVITSNWERSKNSAGTQRILLDVLCDIVIRSRGVFSDFPYPPYIVDKLLELVGKMVRGHGGERPHVNYVIQELEDNDLLNRMDSNLRDRALIAIGPSSHTAPS